MGEDGIVENVFCLRCFHCDLNWKVVIDSKTLSWGELERIEPINNSDGYTADEEEFIQKRLEALGYI